MRHLIVVEAGSADVRGVGAKPFAEVHRVWAFLRQGRIGDLHDESSLSRGHSLSTV